MRKWRNFIEKMAQFHWFKNPLKTVCTKPYTLVGHHTDLMTSANDLGQYFPVQTGKTVDTALISICHYIDSSIFDIHEETLDSIFSSSRFSKYATTRFFEFRLTFITIQDLNRNMPNGTMFNTQFNLIALVGSNAIRLNCVLNIVLFGMFPLL